MKIAKNARTFVNFGVLGLSGGPLGARFGSQVELVGRPLKRSQRSPKGPPGEQWLKIAKFLGFWRGEGFYIVFYNRKCMLAV